MGQQEQACTLECALCSHCGPYASLQLSSIRQCTSEIQNPSLMWAWSLASSIIKDTCVKDRVRMMPRRDTVILQVGSGVHAQAPISFWWPNTTMVWKSNTCHDRCNTSKWSACRASQWNFGKPNRRMTVGCTSHMHASTINQAERTRSFCVSFLQQQLHLRVDFK
eukprot:6402944-Amphidinium_carterae.1